MGEPTNVPLRAEIERAMWHMRAAIAEAIREGDRDLWFALMGRYLLLLKRWSEA